MVNDRRYDLLVQPFPAVGERMSVAYRELYLAEYGDPDDERVQALGPIAELPRPWDPSTCMDPQLRAEVWGWLEAVVQWLNREYVWEATALIPPCWPAHPHLVHEIGTVADQRRRAGLALSSDPLEEWHRYCLPQFVDRMRQRLARACSDRHQDWPARGRFTTGHSGEAVEARARRYAGDIAVGASGWSPPKPRGLGVVDKETGLVLEHGARA